MEIFNLAHIDPSLMTGALSAAEYLERDMTGDRCIEITSKKSGSGLSVRLDGDRACITYSRTSESFRGLGIIKEWITRKPPKRCQRRTGSL